MAVQKVAGPHCPVMFMEEPFVSGKLYCMCRIKVSIWRWEYTCQLFKGTRHLVVTPDHDGVQGND